MGLGGRIRLRQDHPGPRRSWACSAARERASGAIRFDGQRHAVAAGTGRVRREIRGRAHHLRPAGPLHQPATRCSHRRPDRRPDDAGSRRRTPPRPAAMAERLALLHPPPPAAGTARPQIAMLRDVQLPQPEQIAGQIPARGLGRAAPAPDDRHGAAAASPSSSSPTSRPPRWMSPSRPRSCGCCAGWCGRQKRRGAVYHPRPWRRPTRSATASS